MHPILFSIGEFYIGTYGFLIAVGLLAGTFVAIRRSNRLGVESEKIIDLIFFAVLGGLVGGRLTHIAINVTVGDRYLLAHPLEMVFSRTGFVFLGGVIFSTLLCIWYLRRVRLSPWLAADILFGVLPLGHFFGRLGCFSAGCCHGRVIRPDSVFAWLGVEFPKVAVMGKASFEGIVFGDQLAEGLINESAVCSLPVWPVQLFEAAGNLTIFFILAWFWKRRRFDGQILIGYIMMYSVLRFGLEFLRGDVQRGVWGLFSTSQMITLVGFVLALVLWPYLRRRDVLTLAVEPSSPEIHNEKKSPRSETSSRTRKGKKNRSGAGKRQIPRDSAP